jgi:homoserine dehydrogenase
VTSTELTPPLDTPLRVGVLGCGNVGAAFVALVDSGADSISGRTGISLEVTRIAVLDLSRDRPGVDRVTFEKRVTTDAHSIVADPDVDLVVELIGGIEPARSLILGALSSKKPVISGNKELLSTCAGELSAAAESAGVDLLFEASVAGAIPLVRLLRESLAGEHIVRLTGIVNGTTNYMLTRMSDEGLGYTEALAEAQALGYAEADPTADVEGYDAAAKAAILATIAFDADVRAADVHREGITGLERSDIAFAHRLGYEVKLLAIAERSAVPDAETRAEATDTACEGSTSAGAPSVAVRVHPAMVPRDHPLASVRGAFNAVFVEGDAAGELMVYGRGAGGRPTASAVLGDVIDAAHHLREGSRARSARRRVPDLRPIAELYSQYYLSIDVIDRPGVLAAVASVFGDHDVSIRSMEQTGLSGEARLVFITHTALEADLSATLQGLSKLDCVERIGSVLRVIGPEPAGA